MIRLAVVLCALLSTTAAMADVTIQHVSNRVSGWRGGTNISPSYCWISNWPNANADGTLAEFDRVAIQNAINNTVSSTGSWDAKLIVTQVSWSGNPVIPENLGPVAASVDIDPSTLVWGSSHATNAGNGSWRYDGVNQANFVAAVNAGVAAGKSLVVDSPAWQSVWDATLPAASYNIIIDVPESLIVHYLNNTSADGLFVGAKLTGYVAINTGGQWGGIGDVRLVIANPPTTAPWMHPSTMSVSRTIAKDSPTTVVPVTVTNAGSGTLAWTASESPDAAWLSITNGTGTAGGTFQLNFDVSTMAVGTYRTKVRLTDPAAGNSGLEIPVEVTVIQATAPVIQLLPASLTFKLSSDDTTPPDPELVTVNNSGFGTLNWTAAESPDVSWLSLDFASGTNGGQFAVNVNQAGLAGGVYTATVRVTDPNASNSPQTLAVTLEIRDQDADIAKANGYDDAYQAGMNGWIVAMRNVRKSRPASAPAATPGFCVFLGDSITYANPFGQWARNGAGKTAADTAVCNWMNVSNWGSGSNNSNNGWYLAAWDVPGRNGSFTARSGITAAQYLAGNYGLPSMDQMFTAGFTNPDGKQYRDANIAVILLGTNDLGGYSDVQLAANLGLMVDKLIANGIVPVLTTIPPRVGQDAKVATFVTAVRNLAQTRKLPLIDYYQEIIRRRPGTTWQNTLISSDGVHPSGNRAGYTTSSDVYANNGAALSEVGYLLRSWLTVQKIKEVKDLVIDAWPGDINGDNRVNVFDLQAMGAAWNTVKGTHANYNLACDLNLDGRVNVFDLQIMSANWNTAKP